MPIALKPDLIFNFERTNKVALKMPIFLSYLSNVVSIMVNEIQIVSNYFRYPIYL